MKLVQLLSKPRDVNATPSLLMIAPPSDERYRSIAVQEIGSSQPVITQSMALHHAVVPQKLQRTKLSLQEHLMWPNTEQSFGAQETHLSGPSTHLAAPSYLQQLSNLAAMAWSDCTKVSEKLRRIYEQTASLKNIHPTTGRKPYQPSSAPFNFQPNSAVPRAIEVYNNMPGHSMQKPRTVTQTSTPLHHCACAMCHVKRNAQSSVEIPADVTSNLMTSYVVANDSHKLMKANCRGAPGLARSRLKRAYSPTFAPGQYPAAKKLMKSTPHAGATVSSTVGQNSSFSSVGNPPSRGFTNAPNVVSNFFIHPSLQMTASSSTPLHSCDFVVTPVLNHNNYVQPVHPAVGNAPRFNDILQSRIPMPNMI